MRTNVGAFSVLQVCTVTPSLPSVRDQPQDLVHAGGGVHCTNRDTVEHLLYLLGGSQSAAETA